MKWTSDRSVLLSGILVGIFTIAYLIVVIACPRVVTEYLNISTDRTNLNERLFVYSIYICAVPIGIILWKLAQLLKNISRSEVFTTKNINCLRLISWMCFAVTAVSVISSFYYLIWLIIGGCMAFVGMLLRVVKNVFERAKEIKEENDFTI